MSLFRTLLSQLNSSRLPDEYQEVEWIKGTGTQYIDLDFSVPNGMTCEYIAEYNSDYASLNVDGGYIIGSHGSSYPYGRNGGWFKKWNDSWELGYGEVYPSSNAYPVVYGTKYNVKFCTLNGNAYIKVDDNTLITRTDSQSITNTHVYVFTHYYNLQHNEPCTIAKLYYAKIWNSNDELIKELIPCYRKSDNAIGLYDLVEDTFYVNAGTGKFICYPAPPPMPSRLPDEYQEVKYVSANNNAYIKTGFTITTGMKFNLDMMFTGIAEEYIIGAVQLSGQVIRSHLACFNNGGYQFGLGAKEDIWTNLFPNANTRYDIEASTISGNNYIKINGVNYGTGTYSYTLNMECYLGATNGLSLSSKLRGNIYSCKIYDENEVLVRDFVPCYRKADNKTGLYDLVNDAFYTSETGTDFGKGSDV